MSDGVKITCYECKQESEATDDNFDMSNGCNEEGEEYCDICFTCPKCGKETSTYDWGNTYNLKDGVEYYMWHFF